MGTMTIERAPVPTQHEIETSGTAYSPADGMYEARVVCVCQTVFVAVEPTRQFAIDRARTQFVLHKEARRG